MLSSPIKQGQKHKELVAGATLMTKNARLIVQQLPISTIPEIPNLPAHQEAAKIQSKDWLDNI